MSGMAEQVYWRKLSQGVLTSSVWSESPETKVVWITMIAMQDRDGVVRATVPGLARIAGVSIEATEVALSIFLSPDRYSRTADHEGRRIERHPDGWLLLNAKKYQEFAKAAAKREQKLRWWTENRARQNDTVDSATRTNTRTLERRETEERDIDPIPPQETSSPSERPRRERKPITEQAGLVGDCARLWAARWGSVPMSWGKEVVALNKLGASLGADEVVARWKRCLAKDDAWLVENRHPISAFVAQVDRYVEPKFEYHEPKPKPKPCPECDHPVHAEGQCGWGGGGQCDCWSEPK